MVSGDIEVFCSCGIITKAQQSLQKCLDLLLMVFSSDFFGFTLVTSSIRLMGRSWGKGRLHIRGCELVAEGRRILTMSQCHKHCRRGRSFLLPRRERDSWRTRKLVFLQSDPGQLILGSQRLVLDVVWWCASSFALLGLPELGAVLLEHAPAFPPAFKPMKQLCFGCTAWPPRKEKHAL